MHIADYFYTLVHDGESVFVVGTPMKAGDGYVGPAPTTPATSAPTTVAPDPDHDGQEADDVHHGAHERQHDQAAHDDHHEAEVEAEALTARDGRGAGARRLTS